MNADGWQLGEITRLVEAEAIRPVVGRVVAFAATNEAMTDVDSGLATLMSCPETTVQRVHATGWTPAWTRCWPISAPNRSNQA